MNTRHIVSSLSFLLDKVRLKQLLFILMALDRWYAGSPGVQISQQGQLSGIPVYEWRKGSFGDNSHVSFPH